MTSFTLKSGIGVDYLIVNLPDTVAFIYQALHGGMCLQTDQLLLAMNLGRTRVEIGYKNETLSLYKIPQIIGWPDTLAGKADIAWNFLMTLRKMWSWLEELFGKPDNFRVSVCLVYGSKHFGACRHLSFGKRKNY
jgi:hypothetical protein